MYPFTYHRVDSVAEARRLLNEAADGTLIAGGMTLIPTLKQRLAAPSDLIDLGGIAHLKEILITEGCISIGAMATHGRLERDPKLAKALPALVHMAGLIGDPAVRARGTVGGALANADPAADYPAAMLALEASLVTQDREIQADEFFLDLFETALAPGDILTRIDLPVPERAAYAKFRQPASRYALAGVFVAQRAGQVRVGVTGAGPCAFRWTEAEDALSADFAPGALAGLNLDDSRFNADMHGSADYRAHLVRVMAARAVAAAG